MSKTIFISTSIPYVNAAPHIGHALEFVQADAIARFHRLRGDAVFFLTGTDDNALKNVTAAEEAKVSVEEWVNAHAERFAELGKRLNISNDDFIRTAFDERHVSGAQKLWGSCRADDIYKKSYKGFYCLGCEEFKQPAELKNGECAEHPGKKLQLIEEENYFFRLSRYEKTLEELIVSDKLRIVPESRKNETLAFIRGGLMDFSISRSRERAKDWGIPVPGDDSQMMYVWFDALSNYINALGYAKESGNFERYWRNGDERLHVIGKGINRFHTIYWPAMLLSAQVALPTTVFIHGYVTVNGEKMSKTTGNVIDPEIFIKTYGTDAVRYYLLREVPPFEDGDFSDEKFRVAYNAGLANGLGNFAARVLTLGAKMGDLSHRLTNGDIEDGVKEAVAAARVAANDYTTRFRFSDAMNAIWNLIAFGDKYVNDHKPWEKKDDVKTIVNAITILDNVAALLQPFLPETAKRVTACIAWSPDGSAHITRGEALFPRK
ncbi:MAG: methionine--tRNA ligase [bacterium]|nr:methionine--tRNA ligase [bacterium]